MTSTTLGSALRGALRQGKIAAANPNLNNRRLKMFQPTPRMIQHCARLESNSNVTLFELLTVLQNTYQLTLKQAEQVRGAVLKVQLLKLVHNY